MPKELHQIIKYEGGLNNNADPRDIDDNELATALGVMVDEVGTIRSMGGAITHTAGSHTLYNIVPGYGLFQFSHDKDGAELGDGTAGASDFVDYIAFADHNGNFHLYSSADGAGWGASIFEYTDGNTALPVYFNVDGALRLGNGNLNDADTFKWYGYIDRTLFKSNSSGQITIDQWFAADQEIAPPPLGSFYPEDGGHYLPFHDVATRENYVQFLFLESIHFSGEPEEPEQIEFYKKIWNIGLSYVYDGVGNYQLENAQHSTVTPGTTAIGGTSLFTFDATESEKVPWIQWAFPYDTDDMWTNKRITGHCIWIREAANSNVKESTWHLISESNWITGITKSHVGRASAPLTAAFGVGADGPGNEYWYNSSNGPGELCAIEPTLKFGDFGFGAGETITAQYKTAVVANRSTWIGNIRQDGVNYPDRMIKSPVNMPDIFPESRHIDVSVADGDEIIKLEAYADRILQFKRHKLLIYNTIQDVDGLEDVYMHKGVEHPASVCRTDSGIAWVNIYGVYLYDGQAVHNLFERDGRKLIKDSEWFQFGSSLGFINDGAGTRDIPMIGYLPKKRQLIIKQDITSSGADDNDIFLYDMVTRSWVKGKQSFPTTAPSGNNNTNFINDWDGDLVLAYGSSAGGANAFVKWDDAGRILPAYSIEIVTKDIDFGQPGRRKKVNKVYVTYRSTEDSAVKVQFGVNGETARTKDFTYSELFENGTLNNTSGEWAVAELVPDDSSEVRNIKSFQLRFWNNGNTPADFAINDISIVYRLKTIK